MLKLVKIRKLKYREDIIEWLIKLLLESESCYSPLIEKINHPNDNFFILTHNDIIIPAYIEIKGDEALVLWVHQSYRNKGYAKFMITTLGIKYAIAAPSSIPFWKKLGFQQMSTVNSGPVEMKLVK